MRIFAHIAKTVREHPWGVVVSSLVITIFLGLGLLFMEGHVSYLSLLPEGFPSMKTLRTLDKEFGGISYEFVLIQAPSVTDPEIIEFLTHLDDYIKEDPRFDEGQIKRVEDYLTYFTFEMKKRIKEMGIEDLPDGGVLKPFVEKDYLSLPYAEKWLFGRFITKDKKAALVIMKVRPGLSEHQQVKLANDLDDLFESKLENLFGSNLEDAGVKINISGDATLARDFERHINNKTILLLLLAIALVIAALFMAFRRFSDTILPIGFMVLGLVWTFGFMGWVGIPYSIATIAVMPLLLGTALTFVVPFAARYYEEMQHRFRSVDAVGKALFTIGVGVFLAAITNIFGFLVFELSVLPILKEFGLSCAIGTIFIFSLSVTLLPSIMVIRDRVYEKSPEETREKLKTHFDGLSRRKRSSLFARSTDRVLASFISLSVRHSAVVIIVFTALILVVLGVTQIRGLKTDSDLRKLVPKDLPSINADYEIEKYFGGQQQDIILAKGDVLAPESLKAMAGLEDAIADDKKKLYTRSGILGLPDVIAEAGGGTLPQTRAEVEQAMRTIKEGGGTLEDLLSANNKFALITLNAKGAVSTEIIDNKLRLLKKDCNQYLGGAGLQYELGGITPLTKDMTKNIIPTETWSSILSLVLCAIILMILFRSIPFGLITLTVAFAGVAAEIGFLAAMNWPLDVITSLVSALVIGIGVNFGILFTHRYIQEIRSRRKLPVDAIKATMMNLGRANVVAAIATVAAFLIIMLSEIVPLRRFGGATAFAIGWCLITSLTLMPSLLYRLSSHREEPGLLKTESEPEGA